MKASNTAVSSSRLSLTRYGIEMPRVVALNVRALEVLTREAHKNSMSVGEHETYRSRRGICVAALGRIAQRHALAR